MIDLKDWSTSRNESLWVASHKSVKHASLNFRVLVVRWYINCVRYRSQYDRFAFCFYVVTVPRVLSVRNMDNWKIFDSHMAAERLASAILRARDDRNLCKSSIHKRRRRENFGSNFEIFSSLQWESHTPPRVGGWFRDLTDLSICFNFSEGLKPYGSG